MLTTVFLDRRRALGAGGKPNAELAADCAGRASKALTLLEAQLAATQYIAGNDFTLGDINACSTVMLTPMFIDLSAYPRTQQWRARCSSCPAWQRVDAMA